MNDRIKKFMMFIHNNNYEGLQVFDSRNTAGDTMDNVYDDDGITMDICYDWEYGEIFGLTDKEWDEISEWEHGCWRKLKNINNE